jgi:hypothetical protein
MKNVSNLERLLLPEDTSVISVPVTCSNVEPTFEQSNKDRHNRSFDDPPVWGYTETVQGWEQSQRSVTLPRMTTVLHFRKVAWCLP